MAIKVFKVLTHAIIIGLLLAILVTLVKSQRTTMTSTYSSGAPIAINPGPMVAKQPASMFSMDNSIQCVAGPSEKADYYSRGLTPGGLCGGSEYVREQIRDYAIVDGVGGSLLEK
jgi:hypothetical protein